MKYKKKGIQSQYYGKPPVLNEQQEVLENLYGRHKVAVSITIPIGLYGKLGALKDEWEQNRSVFMSFLIHQGYIRLLEQMKNKDEEIKHGESPTYQPVQD